MNDARRLHPLQVSSVQLPRAQQATAVPLQASTVPMQAGTIPATTTVSQALDINSLIQPLITIMIVMMMMKMMTGAMGSIAG